MYDSRNHRINNLAIRRRSPAQFSSYSADIAPSQEIIDSLQQSMVRCWRIQSMRSRLSVVSTGGYSEPGIAIAADFCHPPAAELIDEVCEMKRRQSVRDNDSRLPAAAEQLSKKLDHFRVPAHRTDSLSRCNACGDTIRVPGIVSPVVFGVLNRSLLQIVQQYAQDPDIAPEQPVSHVAYPIARGLASVHA